MSLSTWLAAFALATVLVATAGVGTAGVLLIHRLAEENAIARVRLAADGALQAIERDGNRLLTAATLLAERPTLCCCRRSASALPRRCSVWCSPGGWRGRWRP